MHQACNLDNARPSLHYIYFSNGYAYASNAHVLVRNKIAEFCTLDEEQIKLLQGKLLHKRHYQKILEYKHVKIFDTHIECFGNSKENARFYFCTEGMKYPDAEKITNEALNSPNESVDSVILRNNNIVQLQAALYNSERCEFIFKGENRAIILACQDSESIGMIMPITKYNN
jgi:hypothetical protein